MRPSCFRSSCCFNLLPVLFDQILNSCLACCLVKVSNIYLLKRCIISFVLLAITASCFSFTNFATHCYLSRFFTLKATGIFRSVIILANTVQKLASEAWQCCTDGLCVVEMKVPATRILCTVLFFWTHQLSVKQCTCASLCTQHWKITQDLHIRVHIRCAVFLWVSLKVRVNVTPNCYFSPSL